MTESIRMRRRRRPQPDDDQIPADIEQWFAGELRPEDCPPWSALLPPTSAKLRLYWDRWRKEHPRCSPPNELVQLLGSRR